MKNSTHTKMNLSGLRMILALIPFISFILNAEEGYRVHLKVTQEKTEVLDAVLIQKASHFSEKKLLRRIPYFMAERSGTSSEFYEEWMLSPLQVETQFSKLKNQIERKAYLNRVSRNIKEQDSRQSEVRQLVKQGPDSNRINLSILGDGYLISEKEKFFKDAERTVKGLFEGQTFKSYLSLFNIYAVFVPSKVSGIGDGAPKDTAFKLYRSPKGSKRAIMPGNESALQNALNLVATTDYPIVLANDDFYGGLGGRYAISTRSELSGLVVLRHELGHNFGQVGEEYDNGSAYFGANNSSFSKTSWRQWWDPSSKVNEAKLVSGDYVWQNLNNSKYEVNFTTDVFSGGYFYGTISSVGWETPLDVLAKIDGVAIALEGTFNSDRNFYELTPVRNFPNGKHRFSVEENINDGNNILGFAELYVAPESYDFTPNQIGAYATFNQSGQKSYRPTHASCLMRDMSVNYFCSIDKENIWHQFLNRINLIDDIKVVTLEGKKRIQFLGLSLNGLSIKWYKKISTGWQELEHLRDQREWDSDSIADSYKVVVDFKTDEVRNYSGRFHQERAF